MAEFQHMNGTKVESSIVAVVGNSIHLKVVPGHKESLPTISASPQTVAKVDHVDERKKANFTTFQLNAIAVGNATLVGADSTGASIAGPITVVVQDKVVLPLASTKEGLFVRLFLAEVPSPGEGDHKLEDVTTAMIWMRVVVENRLATPSPEWSSAGATTLTDVIKAYNQFDGFSHYPTIVHKVQKVIDQAISIANNGDDSRRAKYKEFVDAALSVASLQAVTDPSPKGIYWWRTKGAHPPSKKVEVYMTKLGNTFYTLK